MAHIEYYSGNYSTTSFQFFHQDSPLNFDLSNKLGSPSSVRESQDWLKVFPISTDCGANLQTPVLEFHPDDIILQHQQREDDQTELRHENYRQITDKLSNVYFFRPILSTYATRTEDIKEEYAIVFILKLCTCERCRNPEKMIDAMQLEPFRTVVKLCEDGSSTKIMLTFYPGVTSEFNMKKDVVRCSPSKLVYYSNVRVLPSFQLIPFKNYVATLHRLISSPDDEESLRLENKKEVLPLLEEQIVGIRNGQKPRHSGIMLLLRDLVLETSDKKSISCHSPDLFAQGYTPKVMAGADNQEVDKKERQVVEVPEDSIITDLFLQWIYRHDDELLKSQNFAVLIRILNLACQFQIMKLMGTISKLLIEKMDRDSFLWKDEDMWRLYCVISTVNEVQIVVRLKDKVRGEVQRLKQQRKKYGNTKATKLEQDGNAACTAYMDQVFFKILINLVEKDDGVAATVKIL